MDCQRTVEFEIFSHLRHRYAPGVMRNTESWFCLALPTEREIVFTEHLTYRWVDRGRCGCAHQVLEQPAGD